MRLSPILAALVLAGCGSTLEGPAPELVAASPSLACDDQLVTEVVVTGSGLAPMVAAGLEDAPELVLPALELARVGDSTGAADGGTATVRIEQVDVRWIDAETIAFDVDPALGLADGLYDLTVESPDGQRASVAAALVAVDPPTLAAVEPALVCTAQYDNALTLAGTGFLDVGGVLPAVRVGDAELAADALDGCVALAGPTDARACTSAALTLPRESVAEGLHAVVLTNPGPAACATVETVQLEVVPPPVVDDVDPGLECVAQDDQLLTLTGSGFLVVDGALPTVRVGEWSASATTADGCVPVSGTTAAEACTLLVVDVPAAAIPAGVHDVVVTNPDPAGCTSADPVQLEVVPAPTLAAVDPQLECTEQGDQVLALTGTGFVVLADGTPPDVTVGAYSAPADAASGCVALAGPDGGESCTDLTFTLPVGAVPAGVVAVTVDNPAPADCVTTEAVEVEIVPAPSVATAAPALVCLAAGDVLLELTGSDFLVLADGTAPTVEVGELSLATAGSACTTLSGPAGGEACGGLEAMLPADGVPAGVYDLVVANPEPAACVSEESIRIEVVPGPAVSGLDPESACSVTAGDVAVHITGQGFVVLADGTGPVVTLDGRVVASTPVDCTALGGPEGGSSCAALDAVFPTDAYAAGSLAVVVTSPVEGDCVSAAASFELSDPPTVDAVTPDQVCEGGETVVVTGSGFTPAVSVTIGGQSATVTWVDAGTLDVEVPTSLAAGTYDLVVSGGAGCETTLAGAVTVLGTPTVVYVDPPVTYSGIQLQVTAYLAGSDASIVSSWLVEDATGTVTTLDTTVEDTLRVNAVVPAGLPDGSYAYWVEDENGCQAALDDALTVESDLTVAIEAVELPFAWAEARTAVQVTATDPAPASMVQFDDLPRLYLNPSAPDADSVATAFSSVSYEAATLLDAVVPAGLEVGDYDVIVVNPDGSIGVLEAALEVTAEAPPTLDGVSPKSVSSSADEVVTVTGADFRDPTVELTCYNPSTGAEATVSATVTSSSSTEAVVTVPSSGLAAGSVCVVRLTNSDGTYGDYASVSVTNSSGNIGGWAPASDLGTPRRAPAVVAARTTSTARYVYAIGGDDGTAAGAYASIEAARVGPYGDLDGWFDLPGELPAARTYAGLVVLDRYLYLVGGNDGGSAVATTWRAVVLDPADAPQIDALALAYASGSGVGGGTWTYRVAALYGADDPDNPGGESLAGDPFVLRLPEAEDGFDVTLSWPEADGASGYRVYRSPVADAGSGTEEWLADVSGGSTTSYTDTGLSTDAAATPLPKGALGEWADVGSMGSTREGPCVAVGQDPGDPTDWYVYAFGGRDAAGVVLDTIEYLPVTVGVDDVQSTGAWTVAGDTLPTARWQCGAMVATAELNDAVGAGDTWIYAAGGLDDGGAVTDVDAGLVGSGGGFSVWLAVDDFSARAGFGGAAASDYLYVFGGINGSPSTDADSAQICASSSDPGCSRSPIDPPDLRNWNSLGSGLGTARYLSGFAQESGVLLMIGGETDTEAASASTEFVNY